MLNSAFLRFATFFRMAMLLPYITSVAATAIVFAQLFNRDFGLLNWVIGGLGFDHVDFMSTPVGSHFLVSTMVIWRWFGYNTLLYLAALQAVPRDLYEAAAMDGAGPVKQFFHITLPSLRPVIVFTVIMSTIGGLQIFTEPCCCRTGRSPAGRPGSARRCRCSSTNRASGPSSSGTARPSGSPCSRSSSSWRSSTSCSRADSGRRADMATTTGTPRRDPVRVRASRSRRRTIARVRWYTYVLLGLAAAACVFPVYWMFVVSSVGSQAATQLPPRVVPGGTSWTC